MRDWFLKPVTWKILRSEFNRRVLRRPIDVKKSWAETPGDFRDLLSFMNWFDAANSLEDCLAKGGSDWALRFAREPCFGALNKGVCLEIGCGGGRLLAHAARDFETAYGIDIHTSFDKTAQFLEYAGVSNVKLASRDHVHSVKARTVDFVYSFIVFQHFDSVAEIEFYLDQIARCLSPSGIAHIYYGKATGDEITVVQPKDFVARGCSLLIPPLAMREIVGRQFDIVSSRDVLPKNVVDGTGESLQADVVFRLRAA